ncbi:uncharacterized protein LOC129965740 [Argiope bruennichi]|uniref:uncharacterized protein LOC129965740 n=1 Tax=Argiope bruennichi TaxID=94029 RepID=UPI002493FCA1|nr:uncharacterized protein LOC129965740 [Argiope bruennichi]
MEMNGDVDRPELLAETSFDVLLYIYDLSKELAKSFKKILKGKPLPGIWHTGLVAYGREYYFASTGIESCRPGETILGEPDQILTLGKTELPYSVFLEYIFALGESTYRPGSYHLLEHNCNCFSQEVCQFLTGGPIPAEIRELPQEISANKTLSNALKEYFNKLSLRAEGSRGISFGNSERVAEEQRNGHDPAPKPQQNGTRRKKSSAGVNGHSKSKESSTEQRQKEPPQLIEQPQQKPKEQPQPVEQPQQKPKDKSPPTEQQQPQQIIEEAQNSQEQAAAAAASAPPPVPQKPQPQKQNQPEQTNIMSNGTGAAEPTEPLGLPQEASNGVEASNGAARVHLDDEEDGQTNFTPRRARRYEDPPVLFPNVDGPELLRRIMELVEGKLTPEENKDLNEFMEYLTTDGGAWALGSSHLEAIGRLLNDRNLHPEIPILTLKMFQAAALKEDIILLLHQDRERHHLMTYFYKIETLSPEEQTEVCALMCNLCSNGSSFDWLTYISEWEEDGKPCNNCKVTVRVAVHGLLADHPDTKVRGCALVYNLALKKELFDDVASELAMAVLQFLQTPPAEEMLFQSLTALYRFMCISYNEIPALMKMMGPDVEAFRGVSARIEPVVEEIQMKLRVAR